MADITKCMGGNCPAKNNCYRFTAKEGMWQSYFMDVPFNEETKSCNNYWHIEIVSSDVAVSSVSKKLRAFSS